LGQQIPKAYLNEATEFLGETPKFVSSAPGRLDLLNTHQDYKMLSVVPVAVNLRLYLFAIQTEGSRIEARSKELAESTGQGDFQVDLSNLPGLTRGPSGYLSSVIKALEKFAHVRGIAGMKVYIRSEIPIASGMGSSGALEVAFLALLNGMFSLGLDKRDIAEYAYLSENSEMGIPCGRLDQYSSTYGGMIVLRQRPTIDVGRLDFPGLDFVAIDSGEKHRTESVHSVRQAEIDRGLRALYGSSAVPKGLKSRLGRSCQEADWESVKRDEISRYLFLLPAKSADRILFTFQMNGSTELALAAIRGERVDLSMARDILGEDRASRLGQKGWNPRDTLGEVMNAQHEFLRDLYEVSTPKLERIRDAVLYFGGATGVKISGAGVGGSLVALVDNRQIGERAAKEAIEAGAVSAWPVREDTGCLFQGIS